ncbi:hypothetical protein TRVL_05873 [Trypanosoma vivax]|nr:hypothetical protein TRVL_05873 [Trypanosoma vivax]
MFFNTYLCTYVSGTRVFGFALVPTEFCSTLTIIYSTHTCFVFVSQASRCHCHWRCVRRAPASCLKQLPASHQGARWNVVLEYVFVRLFPCSRPHAFALQRVSAVAAALP